MICFNMIVSLAQVCALLGMMTIQWPGTSARDLRVEAGYDHNEVVMFRILKICSEYFPSQKKISRHETPSSVEENVY